MQKEIKEILEEFESLFETSEAPEHIIEDFNKIKDYITNLQEENERLTLIIRAIKKQCEVCEDYEMSEFIKQLENEKEISNWLKRVAGVDKE